MTEPLWKIFNEDPPVQSRRPRKARPQSPWQRPDRTRPQQTARPQKVQPNTERPQYTRPLWAEWSDYDTSSVPAFLNDELSPYNFLYRTAAEPAEMAHRYITTGEMPPPGKVFKWVLGLTLAGKLAALGRVGSSLGTFGGKLAPGRNQAALDKAKDMADKGVWRDIIRRASGWFRPNDDQWRYEIDDSGSELDDLDLIKDNPAELGEVLKHPDLYTAYPHMRHDITIVARDLPEGHHGSFSPPTNEIVLDAQSLDPRLGALHELQHAIQVREGFAPGGNAAMARQIRNAAPAQLKEVDKSLERLGGWTRWALGHGARPGSPTMSKLAARRPPLLADRSELEWTVTATPQKVYESILGEIEARVVQRRMDLTPQQRRDIPPWVTEAEIWTELENGAPSWASRIKPRR